jgi:ABC-type transport system involved in cytochrome c biogenesis permease component
MLLVALLVLGSLGFASVGTVFAAMLARVRTRDVLLPLLLYPITIPVMIAGVLGTSALLQEPVNEPTATMWIGVLASIDTVFLTLALWTFEPLVTD